MSRGGSCWEGDLREGKRKCICISSSQLWSPRHFSPARATPPPCPLSREKQRKQGRWKSCWHSRLAFQDGKVWKIKQHHPLSSKTARWLQSSPASVTWPVSCHFLSRVAHAVFSLILAIPSVLPPSWWQRQEAGRNSSWWNPLSHSAHRGESAVCPAWSSKLWFFSTPSLSSLGDYQRNELVISISSRWKKCWCHPESSLWESCFILPRIKGQPRRRCQSWNESLRPNRPLWSYFLRIRVAPLTLRKGAGAGAAPAASSQELEDWVSYRPSNPCHRH